MSGRLSGMGVEITDQQLTGHAGPAARDRAIRELAASARRTMHERAVSCRVAVVRSPAGRWRIACDGADLTAAEIGVGIQVFRGETAESQPLLDRVAWAVRQVLVQSATLAVE